MTTVKPDGVFNIVNDTMQNQQQKNSNDDEIQHDNNVVPHVHVDAIFCTEYDKCHGSKDGRRSNPKMDDIMQECKSNG